MYKTIICACASLGAILSAVLMDFKSQTIVESSSLDEPQPYSYDIYKSTFLSSKIIMEASAKANEMKSREKKNQQIIENIEMAIKDFHGEVTKLKDKTFMKSLAVDIQHEDISDLLRSQSDVINFQQTLVDILMQLDDEITQLEKRSGQQLEEFEDKYQEENQAVHQIEKFLEELSKRVKNRELEVNEIEKFLGTLQQNLLELVYAEEISPLLEEISRLQESADENLMLTRMETALVEKLDREYAGISFECLSLSDVESEIKNSLNPQSDEDDFSYIDYAWYANGGSIVYGKDRTSATYIPSSKNYYVTKALLLAGLEAGVGAPEEAISSNTRPGSCWAMSGSSGFITVKLKEPITVTSISIEHAKQLSVADRSSAPKKFSLFALKEITSEPVKLLDGMYDLNGPWRQQYSIGVSILDKFNFIKLQIDENHGKKDYTCIYRIQVHGFQ